MAIGLVAGCRPARREAAGAPPRAFERAVPLQPVPAGLASLRAVECARCHADVYAQWSGSVHAEAWHDPQFQAEWRKDRELWLCLNCHTPLANQQPVLVVGLRDGDVRQPDAAPNPVFDPALRDEGVTCAVCHVRDGAVLSVRDAGGAPHPVRPDAAGLSERICLHCHNALADYGGALVCTFDTGDDWARTDLPAQGVTCRDCHLPEVARTAADGTVRRARHHRIVGAGIPKGPSTDPPAPRSGLVVSVEAPSRPVRPGRTAPVRVTVANRLAGHAVPTGDVERFVVLRFRLVDDRGREAWRREERNGESWAWWPAARRLSDNSLARGESRAFDLDVPVPRGATAARLEVVVENHRMTEATRDAMRLPPSYPLWVEAQRVSVAILLRRR